MDGISPLIVYRSSSIIHRPSFLILQHQPYDIVVPLGAKSPKGPNTVHIIVPIKQVPESEELRYDPATRTLVREGVESVINAFDKRALTEAVRLRSQYGGSITAITMGPPHAREALVECLGRGVDRAIHISDRVFAGSDTLATARTLAAVLRRLSFDLG